MASEKITAIIESVKALTVLELSELVHAIEDEFGVSAAAPVAVMGAAAAAPAEEEKTEFTPVLADFGAKKLDVIKVKTFDEHEAVSRELMLLKVSATDQTRSRIAELAQLAGAKVADITRNSLTLECCDTTDRLENLLELMRPFGLKRVVRTGTIALEKGSEQLTIEEV